MDTIAKLLKKIEGLKNKNLLLKKENTELKASNSKLKAKNSTLQSETEKLTRATSTQAKVIEEINQRMQSTHELLIRTKQLNEVFRRRTMLAEHRLEQWVEENEHESAENGVRKEKEEKPWVPKCEICDRAYGGKEHTPRMLSCGHTICEWCAIQIANEQEEEIKCPFDRTKMELGAKGVSGMPKNFAIMQMVDNDKVFNK